MRKIVAYGVIVLSITMTGCGQWMSPFAQATATPIFTATTAPTNTPEPTLTPEPTFTPTIEPTATEIPSPTVDPQVKMNEETIARMNQFLSAEGDYTDKNLNKVLLDMMSTTRELPNNLGLAEASESDSYTFVQNLLLGYKIDQNDIYYVLGNEDRQGERFVYIGYVPRAVIFKLAVFEVDTTILNLPRFGPDSQKLYDVSNEMEIRGFLDQHVGKGVTTNQDTAIDATVDPKNPGVMVEAKSMKFATALINRVQRPNSSVATFVAGNGFIGNAGFFYKSNPITVDDLNNLTPSENILYVISMNVGATH
jgi:hypothetical protein